MARAIWKGMISFGLVSVPVELHPAKQSHQLSFSMLDKRDFGPVGYKRYNKSTGKEVAWNDIVKGYEYEKDEYVVLSDEDFRRANVQQAKSVDIATFVDATSIPPHYFETPYYLAPGERGQKVYALLRETLRATRKIGVGQVVIRTTHHLAAVMPVDEALMMITMRYANQIREHKEFDFPPMSLKSAGVTPKELDLARKLIDDMSGPFRPEEFEDTYNEDLMHRIEEKVARGETKVLTKPEGEKGEARTGQVIDLMELLKKSIGSSEGRGRKGADGAARRASVTNVRDAPKARAAAAGATRTQRKSAHKTTHAGKAAPEHKPASRRKRA
jgi:DNA end-binding protein Ku